jgi:hypothetical protein
MDKDIQNIVIIIIISEISNSFIIFSYRLNNIIEIAPIQIPIYLVIDTSSLNRTIPINTCIKKHEIDHIAPNTASCLDASIAGIQHIVTNINVINDVKKKRLLGEIEYSLEIYVPKKYNTIAIQSHIKETLFIF